MNEIFKELERALMQYTSGNHYDDLLKAKEIYFSLTGKINEDDEDYELRMNSFNEWYLFHYKDGVVAKEVEDSKIKEALTKINYSLFEFLGQGLTKKRVIKDLLHDKKITLAKELPSSNLVKNDLFVGRVVEFNGEGILLTGLCFLPSEIKSVLKKETKKLRKRNSTQEDEEKFLINLEAQRNRWARYGHLSPQKFFCFDD